MTLYYACGYRQRVARALVSRRTAAALVSPRDRSAVRNRQPFFPGLIGQRDAENNRGRGRRPARKANRPSPSFNIIGRLYRGDLLPDVSPPETRKNAEVARRITGAPESQGTLLFFEAKSARERDGERRCTLSREPRVTERRNRASPDRNVRAYRPGINCPMNHASYHAGQFLCACLALITPMPCLRPVVGSLSAACYVDLRSRCPAALRRDSSCAVHLIVRWWIYMSAPARLSIGKEIGARLFLAVTRPDSPRDTFFLRIRARCTETPFSVYARLLATSIGSVDKFRTRSFDFINILLFSASFNGELAV